MWYYDTDDVDDLYIMVKCMSVCLGQKSDQILFWTKIMLWGVKNIFVLKNLCWFFFNLLLKKLFWKKYLWFFLKNLVLKNWFEIFFVNFFYCSVKIILECGKIISAGGKIILAGHKIILAYGKILLAGGKIILTGGKIQKENQKRNLIHRFTSTEPWIWK